MKASGSDNVVHVLDPDADRRAGASEFGLTAHAEPGDWLRDAAVVVLAIKPQQAHQAVSAAVPYVARPMVISIVAGVQGQTLARWHGHQRIVRAMPNTPALIRAGITGVHGAVSEPVRTIGRKPIASCGRSARCCGSSASRCWIR
jgi:pyrroline-5-carboxylate reductase